MGLFILYIEVRRKKEAAVMQTLYYNTKNYIRHTGNVIDLTEYRRRLAALERPDSPQAAAARSLSCLPHGIFAVFTKMRQSVLSSPSKTKNFTKSCHFAPIQSVLYSRWVFFPAVSAAEGPANDNSIIEETDFLSMNNGELKSK